MHSGSGTRDFGQSRIGPRSRSQPDHPTTLHALLRPEEQPKVNVEGIEGVVTDKGYHSGEVVERMESYEVKTYIPEKQQSGNRHWEGKAEEQEAVYRNRRRVQGEHGKNLLRRRGELVERSFAHSYETGGMRRTHLRGHENILKRQLLQVERST